MEKNENITMQNRLTISLFTLEVIKCKAVEKKVRNEKIKLKDIHIKLNYNLE